MTRGAPQLRDALIFLESNENKIVLINKFDNSNLINYNEYVSQRNRKLHVEQNFMQQINLPSYDFIAGLLTSTSSFLWVKQKNSEVPVFQLKVQSNDHQLLELVKAKLEIKESIHQYIHQSRAYSLLLIRSRRTIENTLIPIFNGRLFGQKQIQFDSWKKRYFEKKLDFIYKKHS